MSDVNLSELELSAQNPGVVPHGAMSKRLRWAASTIATLTKERDECRAACAWMMKVIECAAIHDHADGDETDCQLCAAVKSVLDRPNPGQPILDRLVISEKRIHSLEGEVEALRGEVETDRDCIESLRNRLVQTHAALKKAKELLIETKTCCIAPSQDWEDRRDDALTAIKECGL